MLQLEGRALSRPCFRISDDTAVVPPRLTTSRGGNLDARKRGEMLSDLVGRQAAGAQSAEADGMIAFGKTSA